MKIAENETNKFRLGVRIPLDLNDRLDELVTELKRGKPSGQRPSKDSVVGAALEHYIAYKQGKGDEVHAHFDGKVIIPDHPLDLQPDQAVIVQIKPLESEQDQSALAWIAANAVESRALPTDLADQHDHYLYGRAKKDKRK